MNNSSHSSLSDAPAHRHKPQLSGAGYITLSPLSFFEWDDKEPTKAPPSPLSPSAVGAFVNKAKAMLKGKRNSWQSPSTESSVVRPLIHRAQTFRQSKPAVPRRQSTDPILPNQPMVAGTSRPSRRRTGGSMQIGPPQLIHSTMFPEFAQDSAPLAPRCTPTPPPLQISPRARGTRMMSLGSLSTMLEHVQSPTDTTRAHCGEFDRIPRSVSGSTALSCPAVGTKAGVAQTLRGYPGGKRPTTLSSPSSNNFNRTRSRLLEGLDLGVSETMVAISEAGLLHDSNPSNKEHETSILYAALSRMLASFDDSDTNSSMERDGGNPSHHLVEEPLELGEDTLHSVRSPEQGESSTSVNSEDSDTFPSRPMTMDKCLEHMTASQPGSLLTPWRAVQPTRSRFEIQSLKGPQRVETVPNETCVVELHATVAGPSNAASGSRSLLSAPPAIPVRSARRPVSRGSSYVSEHSVTSVPVVPVTDVNGIPAADKTRQDAQNTFIEPKIAYAIKGKKRSHKRLSKTKTRPSNFKRIAKQHSGEWMVVPTLPRTARPLYASSSSTRLGPSKAPRTRGRIVKSPSIRSGLVRHGGSGRRSSRSRSRVSIQGAFSTSHSTRSLPSHSNSKAKGKAVEGFPVRPPRSRARPRLDLGDGGKENLPTSAPIDDDLPRCEPSRPARTLLNTGVSGSRCSDESSHRPIPPRNPARAALRV